MKRSGPGPAYRFMPRKSLSGQLHRSAKKNVEFVLEKIGVISKVVSPVRTAPARQVFESS